MEASPTGGMALFQLAGLLIQGVGLVVLIGAAWSLSGKLATLVAKLEFLSKLPERLASVELNIGKLETDVNQLWMQFRAYCDQQEKEADNLEKRERERIESIMEAWDRRNRK